MKFLTRLAVLFYVTSILFLACLTLLFVFNVIDLNSLLQALEFAYTDIKLRWVLGIIAVILLIKNFIYSQAISDRKMREKTIAFDNPSGRVTVSLMALEDLVRKIVLSNSTDVKEIKVNIVVSRKGRLDVFARLALQTEVNIPDMTSSLQEVIKRKIQETVGIDEPINVRIHISKFVAANVKTKSVERPQYERNVPFQGYRA